MPKEFLISLLKSGIKLDREHCIKLFELPHATEFIKAYLSKNRLNSLDNCQLLLFGRPDSPELVLYYVEQGYWITPEIEEKLFELPNAEKILRTYIKNGFTLTPKAQVKLFDLPAPYAEEIVKLYKTKNPKPCRNFRLLLRKNYWHKN